MKSMHYCRHVSALATTQRGRQLPIFLAGGFVIPMWLGRKNPNAFPETVKRFGLSLHLRGTTGLCRFISSSLVVRFQLLLRLAPSSRRMKNQELAHVSTTRQRSLTLARITGTIVSRRPCSVQPPRCATWAGRSTTMLFIDHTARLASACDSNAV